MPHPSEELCRAVLSIDLGASYTKIALRQSWKERDVDNTSLNLKVDGEFHIPSIAVDLGDGKGRRFGTDAEGLNPGSSGRIYRNWKSVLFDSAPVENTLSEAKKIAEGFLRWIKEKLSQQFDWENVRVRICIPALAESSQGEGHLREAAKAAGWSNTVEFVAEPRANLIGLASSGRNVARNAGGGLSLKWGEMFSSLFFQAMQLPNTRIIPTGPVRFAVIDIGAFTTDIGICAIEETGDVKMSEGVQSSFKLGIAEIDEKLVHAMLKLGVEREQMTEVEFKKAKEIIYRGDGYDTVIGKTPVRIGRGSMNRQIAEFAQEVVGICKDHIRGRSWYILTGGGFEIPLIREHVKAALNALGMRSAQEGFLNDTDRQDSRLATALGGASVALDRGEAARSTGPRVPVNTATPSVHECSCGGMNKECGKCHGTSVVAVDSEIPKPVAPGRLSVSDDSAQSGIISHPLPRGAEESRFTPVRPDSRGMRNETDETCNVTTADLHKQWNEAKALAEFTLDGWMGELVFGEKLLPNEQQKRFLDHSSASGMGAWLRLLCLASCFGVRTKPRTIEHFWRTRLTDVWRVFTPAVVLHESEGHDWRALDEVFLEATHRSFRDSDASGEDAELWRRVFYDFRKLHQFVYRNSFPAAILEVAGMRETTPENLVNFMKSGNLPNVRWTGVLGQSMTSPLFFVLRELRRLGVIDSRFDPVCFYMNSPGRNVGTCLGWIAAKRGVAYGVEELTEFSTICHKRMQSECAELSPLYDLALQWFDFSNW